MSLRTLARRLLARCPFFYRPGLLTAHAVTWAYRLFLDRNPEGRSVVRQKLRGPIAGIPDLRRDMILSAEFARKNPDLAPFPFGSVVIAELSCGKRLYVDLADGAIGAPIVRGEYETPLVAALPALVEPGTTALDVGANIGFFTMHLAAALGDGGRVVAFEPIRELAALLARSVAENRLEGVVTIEEAAAGASSGTAGILYVHRARNPGASYLVPSGTAACATSHEIRTVRMVALDDCAFPGRVSFIKLDIEGAEPLCVRGATRLLRRDRPVVLSEVHPVQLERVCGVAPGEYLATLCALDYRCLALGPSGWRALDSASPIAEVTTVLFAPRESRVADRLRGGGPSPLPSPGGP
jgi:FkbM family methyltransferase